MSERPWILRGLTRDQEVLKKELASKLPLQEVTLDLLIKKGFTEEASIEKFLHGKLSDFPDPFQLDEMDLAVERILKAIRNRERVVLFGDYDVDGITGTAQLYLFLKEIGLIAIPILPHRLHDGYGLTEKSVARISAEKPDLLITIDNGTKSISELSFLKSQGVDTVVVDHHETPIERPPVTALINPKVSHSRFPERNIASAGLMFLLLIALRAKLREKLLERGAGELPNLKKYLDLACLGTVADMVPMTGTNRLIVKYGLQELDRTGRPGLRALKAAANVSVSNAAAIGFRIAPRINAAGRLEDPMSAFRVLTAETDREAFEGAQKLEELNRLRQQTEETALREALIMAQEQSENSGLVVASPHWHLGVVGIVAAKLVDRFQKPSIVLSVSEKTREAKGSARTVPGISVYAALKTIESEMIRFGGHDAAAGLTVSLDNLDRFSRLFSEALQSPMANHSPVFWCDAELSLSKINLRLIQELDLLAPHGPENLEPIFMASSLQCHSARIVGERHLKTILAQDFSRFEAIAFDTAHYLPAASSASERHDILFSPQLNTWNGNQEVQIKIKQIKITHRVKNN